MSQVVTLQTPTETLEGVILTYTSEEGKGGCQGFVRPGTVEHDGKVKPVQIKKFYKHSVDDRGEPFSQDPDEEAQKSYETLQVLQEKGFKVCPYFALATSDEGNVLVLEDLTQQGSLQVIDEKHMHQDRKTADLIFSAPNWKDVSLDGFRNALLRRQYHVNMGYGVARMFTRDPKTHLVESFITDVGECFKEGWPGKLSEILPYKDFEASKPLEVYAALLGNEEQAQELFARLEQEDPVKMDFMRLVPDSIISHSFWYFFYNGDNYKFGVANFAKTDFHEDSLGIKVSADHDMVFYEALRGQPLFNWGSDAQAVFDAALQTGDEEGLMLGIDYAHLVCLDRDLFYLDQVRKANAVVEREPLPTTVVPLLFFDDKRKEEPLLPIFCEGLLSRRGELMYQMDVAVSWSDGYRYANHATFPLFIMPEQVRGVYVSQWDDDRMEFVRTPIPDFDQERVRLEITVYTTETIATYVHDTLRFHTQCFFDDREPECQLPPMEMLQSNPRVVVHDKTNLF